MQLWPSGSLSPSSRTGEELGKVDQCELWMLAVANRGEGSLDPCRHTEL